MNPLKLKINLENMPHTISRKLLVPEDMSMLQLHLLIQVAMGWENYHMWQFSDAQRKSSIKVTMPTEDGFGFGDQQDLDAYEATLKAVFLEKNGAKPFWYWYDFGDDWWHKISFLRTNKKDRESFDGTPVCLEALGNCPPEDCGGPWGYGDLLETINDPTDENYAEMREWVGLDEGETWPVEAPPLDFINQELRAYYQAPEWEEHNHS